MDIDSEEITIFNENETIDNLLWCQDIKTLNSTFRQNQDNVLNNEKGYSVIVIGPKEAYTSEEIRELQAFAKEQEKAKVNPYAFLKTELINKSDGVFLIRRFGNHTKGKDIKEAIDLAGKYLTLF